MAQYVLPLIGDRELHTQIHSLISGIKEIEEKLTGPIDDEFWQALNVPVNKLLGSIDDSEKGLVSKIVTALCA